MNIEDWEAEGGFVPPEPEEPAGTSAFDPQSFVPVVVIQLSRIYDVLMAILAAGDKNAASYLNTLHSQGKLLSPPPAYVTEE